MMDAMRALLVDLGVPDRQIRQEAFVSRPDVDLAPRSADAAGELPRAPVDVVFARAGCRHEAAPGRTVLECAEAAGVRIPFECRSGVCGQCKTRLISGRVAMPVEDALGAADRARGLILACQARPLQPVEVDA
jgi:ferredoxin